MNRGRQLSIRARLTLFFVISIAVVLAFTGVALVNLVHRSLVTSATNQIEDVIAQTQARFATTTLSRNAGVILPMHGDVVIQVTNTLGTKVWAASSAIAGAPVLAHGSIDATAKSGFALTIVRSPSTAGTTRLISDGQVQSISTSRGPGLVFGYIYGTPIAHSEGVLLVSVVVSFPLLLLLSGGLIWLGIGLALAPVESIRRRVDAIAARDLSERVPVTGGDDEIARMARTVNAMLDRLEAASRFQQEFVSNASHELRSPLTTLLATVERAQSDQKNVNWTEVAETITREGRRLDGLIEDLFWLARHDENQVETVSVDVDTSGFAATPGAAASVTATITCQVSMVDLSAVPGLPGTITLTGRGVSPLDVHREIP